MPEDDRKIKSSWLLRVLHIDLGERGGPAASKGAQVLDLFRTRWAEAVAASETEARALTDHIIELAKRASPASSNLDILKEERWLVLKAELEDVRATVDTAIVGASDAPLLALRKASASALGLLARSPLLSLIDDNGFRKTSVAARLRKLLDQVSHGP